MMPVFCYGDQLTDPWCCHCISPQLVQNSFCFCPFPHWVKKAICCHCDQLMYRIHQNEKCFGRDRHFQSLCLFKCNMQLYNFQVSYAIFNIFSKLGKCKFHEFKCKWQYRHWSKTPPPFPCFCIVEEINGISPQQPHLVREIARVGKGGHIMDIYCWYYITVILYFNKRLTLLGNFFVFLLRFLFLLGNFSPL